MMIFSTKITKKKTVAIALICACMLMLLLLSIPQADAAAGNMKKTTLKSNEERLDYIATYGWQVSPEPVEVLEIVIPSEFDETYETYNVLQKSQGFDLASFKGKKAMRYTYEITNYPTPQESAVNLNLLVIDDKLIGGDVTSVALGGFMHSLEMPSDTKPQQKPDNATNQPKTETNETQPNNQATSPDKAENTITGNVSEKTGLTEQEILDALTSSGK